jgi:hypothetical protein
VLVKRLWTFLTKNVKVAMRCGMVIDDVRRLHAADVAVGFGRVLLAAALA